MLGDLLYIHGILFAALQRFERMRSGRVWDGNLTGKIDPNNLAQAIGSLEGKIGLLEPWLTGNWTPLEEVILLEFTTAWETAELTIKRYGYTGIPDTSIPQRGDKDAKTDLVDQRQDNPAGGFESPPLVNPVPEGLGPQEQPPIQ